ncbi:MAG: AAA family ATPase [Planctomycetaceae bacterium]|nr:AAA family ATPase [Planctomycetaceae bacterium]
MKSLHDAAIQYAELGYPVFPCGNGKSPVPLTKRGFKDASADPEQIEAWWKQYPDANIGLATEGLLVIDVDGSNNPWLTEERAAEFELAPAARTPRGGWHFVFSRPEHVNWRCSAGQLALHVDVRTDGGYIVVSPSKRPDGEYQWLDGRELNAPVNGLSEPPAWLALQLDELAKPKVASTVIDSPRPRFDQARSVIPNGQRNSTLASIAGKMRQAGLSESEILAGLEQVNRTRCNPALDAAEVAKIATSIARYQPGPPLPYFPVPSLQTVNGQAINGMPAELESNVVWFSEIEPVEIDWLWPARIPAGRITLLVGLPGKGKSLVTVDMAARVSTGTNWPDGSECPQGSAILITAEDNPNDTIRPRLDAAGADVSSVGLLSMIKRFGIDGKRVETPFTLIDVFELENELERVPDCRLIVIDPIGSFLGSKTDAHRDNEVRSVLSPVAKLAEKHGAAVVVVAHRRKSHGQLADDMALGSRAFTGLARAVWHVTPDPNDKERRLFLPGKNNLAKESNGLAFTITGEHPYLNWESEPVAMNADECLAAEMKSSKPGPKADAQNHAMDWLRGKLESSDLPARDLYEEARESEAISKSTLTRAKQKLEVESYRDGSKGPWYWRLPGTQVASKNLEPEYLEHLVTNLKQKVAGPSTTDAEQGKFRETSPESADAALDDTVTTR